MTSQAIKTREPVLGYEVTDRIGAGGYGEVWRATAPGGLTKAIKFVYGFLDDERAKRELKALARVKQVRHPFLLSLERIEVVDGQLVIITELADMSLKDRHEQCKSAGMVGIPRDELLGYMHDAADALDYMREKYSLQHLDVKPENLLLVGGHVKVADFGLVKDIDDTRASMMGGLTPIYAPPEVFDDRPSQCSDQYSLAIVYQELLTGTLPFPGKTTAQLAAQHLQSRARLTALPPDDKPIIERALSKAPEQRFPDCREMVNALISAGRTKEAQHRTSDTNGDTTPLAVNETHQVRPVPSAQPAAPAGLESRTQTLGECQAEQPSRTGEVPAPVARRVRTAPVVNDLAPLAAPPGPFWRPALFVGIGGTGRLVLEHLQGRLQDRFGSLDSLPAIRLLAADTDANNPTQIAPQDGPSQLAAQETQALPLRKSEDYRCGSTKLLAWMSRRWLYNIPRSLQTEGLRPLGRLALVDHAAALADRLTAAFSAITDPAAVAATAERVAMPLLDARPRVFFVASISGGAGSGMAIDVAYLLSKLLKDRGLPDDLLNVILLHSTPRNPAAHDLAVANAYATLSELAHYCERGYAGEAACNLPPLRPIEARLPNVYLVHLGGELGEQELPTAAGSIAEYLYLSTSTAAAGWLDAARQASAEDPSALDPSRDVGLRTFGICDLGLSRELVAAAADEVCVALVERWCGERHARRNEAPKPHGSKSHGQPAGAWSSAEIDRVARERVAMMRLSIDDVSLSLRQAAEEALGREFSAYLSAEVAKVLRPYAEEQPTGDGPSEQPSYLDQLDRLLGAAPADEAEEGDGVLAAAIDQHVKDAARLRADCMRDWARELADNPSARLKGATRAVECVARQVRELRDLVHTLRTRSADELRAAAAAVAKSKPRTRSWHGLGTANHAAGDLQAQLVHYGELRVQDTILAGVAKLAQLLGWDLSNIVDQFKEAQRDLVQLAAEFAHDEPRHRHAQTHVSEAAGAIAAGVRDMLEGQIATLADRLDVYFQEQFVRLHGGLCGGLSHGTESRGDLARSMRVKARAAVLEAIRAAAVGEKVLAKDASTTGNHDLLRSCLTECTPGLIACGGDRRLLVVTSSEQAGAPLAQAVMEVTSHAPSIVVEASSEPVLCYEAASVPLANAAAALIEGQPHCAQLAARLHTRCDIDWLRLDDA